MDVQEKDVRECETTKGMNGRPEVRWALTGVEEKL